MLIILMFYLFIVTCKVLPRPIECWAVHLGMSPQRFNLVCVNPILRFFEVQTVVHWEVSVASLADLKEKLG